MIEQKINLGLLGLGTVGSSVVKILSERKNDFKLNYGVEFKIDRIAVRQINAKRKVKVSREILTDNPDEILNNPNIDTVIELIGGVSPAKDFILKALRNKKNVVTGNKHLLALHGDKLINEALKNNCYLGFRAAITGCHQILEHLSYGGPSINNIVGIFNGTCNYILTEMERSNENFNEVLKRAQECGYAEQDPSMDIDGIDTADKAIIIARIVYGLSLKTSDFHVEGIRGIDIQDIKSVKELGYRIKLLAIMKRDNDMLEIRIHPALVQQNKAIAMLKGIENGIQISDDLRGPRGLYAEGAGGNPTASAVIMDLMNIANNASIAWTNKTGKLSVKRMNSVNCKYYMRINALNKPGALARVSSVLGKFNINIRNVIQKGEERKIGAIVPIIIITDEALERDVQKAIKQINSLKLSKEKAIIIRIEDNVL